MDMTYSFWLSFFFQIEKEKEQKSKQFKKENEEKINTIQDIESCKFMSSWHLFTVWEDVRLNKT